eukprot:scaffold133907_cov25-Tisochrysis_lutea.AAC.2
MEVSRGVRRSIGIEQCVAWNPAVRGSEEELPGEGSVGAFLVARGLRECGTLEGEGHFRFFHVNAASIEKSAVPAASSGGSRRRGVGRAAGGEDVRSRSPYTPRMIAKGKARRT